MKKAAIYARVSQIRELGRKPHVRKIAAATENQKVD
jgi:hypothetical protein